MAAAFGMAWLFRRTLFQGQRSMLLLEMPPYRWPSWKSLGLRLLERAGIFVKRAGTIILALSIVIWALSTYPKPSDPAATPSEALAQSAAGQLGKLIEPVIEPLGYDWKIGIGLVASFAAREVFVSTMGIVYAVGADGASDDDEGGLSATAAAINEERRADGSPVYTPLVCLGLMVFYVLAMQCISTIAIVRRETNTWRWPLFQLGYMTALAYLGALVVYQGGRLLGFS
jgi:ferrous iron transport protein B